MSGLLAGRTLVDRGLSVRILEKSSVVGGRLATRSVGPGRGDDGCQFFTVRQPRFGQLVERWLEEGLVFEWARGWNDGSLAVTRDGNPRYAAREGFAALAKRLAQGLDVRLNAGLKALDIDNVGWVARDEAGRTHRARAVLMTPPAPISLALLDSCEVSLAEADRAALERIDYSPCLTALFWIENDRGLPAPGAVQRPEANLRWIADNRRKGISPEATIFTAQAGPIYSRQLWDITDQQILSAMRVDVLPFLHDDARIVQSQLQRWQYSQPTVVHPERFLMAQNLPVMAFAGDGFTEPWLEGAALSGLMVADALAEKLAE
jgi:predicted NAD/FAD-dependent oxidoreductase